MQIVATRTLTSRLAAPVLSATPFSATQINLSWTAPVATGQSVIAGRRLYRATSASGPWTALTPPTGNTASSTGLTTGATYFYYVEYYDQYQTGLPSNIVSAQPLSLSGAKRWFPGWVVLLDNFIDNASIRSLHLNPTFNQAGNTGHIAELASMPNVTAIKVLVYWGTLETGTTVGNATYDWSLLDQYLAACVAVNKKLIVSVFPITFNNVSEAAAHGGRFFPLYISENPTTYGITKLAVPGYMARTWRASVTERLNLLHDAMAARYDSHPNFGGCQTEETSMNVADGVDGYTYALYTQQLKLQIDRLTAAFVNSQVRTSTNFANNGDAGMQDIVSYCAARGCGCGGPDVLPRETIPANRIFSGFTGPVDYRGAGPYGAGTGGANLTPWYSEIQLPEMGSGKEGDYTMLQLYNCAMLGQGNSGADGGTGTNITVTGMRPMNPNYFVVYRNTSSAAAPDTFRLNWYSDVKPFINSRLGYGSNLYPVNQPT